LKLVTATARRSSEVQRAPKPPPRAVADSDSRVQRARIVRAFVWTGLISAAVFASLVVVGSVVVRSTAADQGKVQASDLGELTAEGVVGPYLTPEFFAGSERAREELDHIVRTLILEGPAFRL
jgi:hypothetical protein